MYLTGERVNEKSFDDRVWWYWGDLVLLIGR